VCRLFGLHGGRRPVSATFWLLEAAGSLAVQSHSQPDGYGIGTFEDDGSPDVDKGPIRAVDDELFAAEARTERSRTFVAHLRFASTGPAARENTHPFEQQGRLFAHNGVLWGLDEIDHRLGRHRDLVRGATDSERLFALITRETQLRDGDVEEGVAAAIAWVADNVPVFSLNFVLATDTDLWAMRYPQTHNLFVLERHAGGPDRCHELDETSSTGTIHVHSDELLTCGSVVVATERMDDDPAWRPLGPGELLHVSPDLRCTSSTLIDRPPATLLTIDDLDQRAAASQTAESTAVGTRRDLPRAPHTQAMARRHRPSR
jgi:predicted glutamine amidotransferase